MISLYLQFRLRLGQLEDDTESTKDIRISSENIV